MSKPSPQELIDALREAGIDIEQIIAEGGDPDKAIDAAIEGLQIATTPDIEIKSGMRLVDVEEFIESPYYLNQKGAVWPGVMQALIDINMTDPPWLEAVLTGGIGVAKTTIALYTQAYQLYKLACYQDPHFEFGLDPTSEIMIIFQSMTASLAKAVDFHRFKAIIDRSRFFREKFDYDRTINSELRFPNRIIVKPVAGTETGAIGQNVIGGILDEINFMATVENSKRARGTDSEFDQAKALYTSIARRRESRFLSRGQLPGMLCLVSSANYPGQFTDLKVEEAKQGARIYVYDKRIWELKPDAFGGGKFHVFIGTPTQKPRIINAEEVPYYNAEDVMSVPIEFEHQFKSDILNALRDIGGVATQSLHPFMLDTDAISDCFDRVRSIFSTQICDFEQTNVKLLTRNIVEPERPRWIHVDLAISGDSAGLAVGWVPQFTKLNKGDGVQEVLPSIRIDGILEIAPPPSGEIIFDNIRRVIYALRKHMNVEFITFDSFQSTDSIQILRQQGLRVGKISLDRDSRGYDLLKTTIYDGRLASPEHMKCLRELAQLQRDATKGKIDHPPNGSKDCADAVAGVVYGLTMHRRVWRDHGVPTTMIPQWLLKQAGVEGISRNRPSREDGKQFDQGKFERSFD